MGKNCYFNGVFSAQGYMMPIASAFFTCRRRDIHTGRDSTTSPGKVMRLMRVFRFIMAFRTLIASISDTCPGCCPWIGRNPASETCISRMKKCIYVVWNEDLLHIRLVCKYLVVYIHAIWIYKIWYIISRFHVSCILKNINIYIKSQPLFVFMCVACCLRKDFSYLFFLPK